MGHRLGLPRRRVPAGTAGAFGHPRTPLAGCRFCSQAPLTPSTAHRRRALPGRALAASAGWAGGHGRPPCRCPRARGLPQQPSRPFVLVSMDLWELARRFHPSCLGFVLQDERTRFSRMPGEDEESGVTLRAALGELWGSQTRC